MNYKCSSVSYCGKIKTLAHNQNNVPCLRGGGRVYTDCMHGVSRKGPYRGQEEYVRGTIPGTVQFLGIARVDFQAVPILNQHFHFVSQTAEKSSHFLVPRIERDSRAID